MYTDDNDGKFPVGAWAPPEYYKDEKIWLCPAAVKPFENGGRNPFCSFNWGLGPRSYHPNAWTNSEACYGTQRDELMWKSPYVKTANRIPMFLDGSRGNVVWHKDDPPAFDGELYTLGTNVSEMKGLCLNRHNEVTNGAFCDFSVRRIGLKELWELPWHRQWNKNNDPPPQWPRWMQHMKDYAIN